MRGGISFEGLLQGRVTVEAGTAVKAYFVANGSDALKGKAVVITGNGIMDFGLEGQAIDGVIDVYEADGYMDVVLEGFAIATGLTVLPAAGNYLVVNGAGLVKPANAGVKQSMTKVVTTKASTGGTITVTVTAAGSTALAAGKAIPVTVDTTTVATNGASVRAALAADPDVAAYFTVGGATDTVILTRKFEATNETESIAFTLGTAVAFAMGSTTDVAGVAPAVTNARCYTVDATTKLVELKLS